MYGKLFASMYDGSLYGQWQAIVTFQQMIVLCGPDGVIDMTPQALAARTSIPLDIITKGIELLEAPDQYSRTPDQDGRRIERLDGHRPWGWRIINYRRYRQMVSAEEKREADRIRIAVKRASERQSTTVDGGQQVATGRDETRQSQKSQSVADVAQAEAEAEAVKKGRARAPAASPPPPPKDVDPIVWNDWLALRRSKKAPVTDTVIAAAQAEAAKAKLGLEAFLREWVLRGSQGLKAEWLRDTGAGAAKPATEEKPWWTPSPTCL